MKNIEQHASENVCKILLGNKCDLTEKKVVDTSRGQSLADEYGIRFLETSAKLSLNVEDAFITIARDIKKKIIDVQESAGGAHAGPGKKGPLELSREEKKSKGCC